ncbi:ABC transporter ATP-binding protein [Aeromonas simiae]|uniref:ABC transporter ATP-binding protein n=1 Tax=Aeromonas simiae TaxID=218936 RepID=UPI0005A7C3A9|nr:ABC transporter ATP-binding protein [Aeromonas simiae]
MSVLCVERVSCRYNGSNVLEDLSLHVAKNEIVCLLGASGCGKTTLLKAIVGLLPLAAGAIRLGERLLEGEGSVVAPEDRQIGMIFQDYALFPHLTVAGNIAFGIAHLPAREQAAEVEQVLALVNLQGLADRYPHQLSGGQQQRVAIARALVCRPRLMLLDEPFSNIDTQVRMKLIAEIRTLLKSRGIGAVFVSHSKEEAFAFADRLALFRAGHIEQVGEPERLYRRPGNRFVADFLGATNYLPAEGVDEWRVMTPVGPVQGSEPHGLASGQRAVLMLRPHQLRLIPDEAGCEVREQQFLGHHCKVTIACGEQLLEASCSEPLHASRVRVDVAPHPLVLFDPAP